MAKQFICDGEKYTLAGQTDDSVCLPVIVNSLPEKIEVDGYTLFLKSEFHVTLVAIGRIIIKHSISIPDFREEIIKEFCEFTQIKSIDFLRYTNEFRSVIETEKRSLVIMCDISNLKEFFDLVNLKYNLQLEYPPTHVTLYTLQPNVGIYLGDSSDIIALTKVIAPLGVNL